MHIVCRSSRNKRRKIYFIEYAHARTIKKCFTFDVLYTFRCEISFQTLIVPNTPFTGHTIGMKPLHMFFIGKIGSSPAKSSRRK